MRNAIFDVEEYEREHGEIETVYPSLAAIPENVCTEIVEYAKAKHSKLRIGLPIMSALIALGLYLSSDYCAEFCLVAIPFVLIFAGLFRREFLV